MPATKRINDSFTQADGAVVITTPSFDEPTSQVSFATDSTTGTVAIRAKYHPDADFETVYEDDGATALVIDLTNLKSFQLFDKWVYSFEFTPTDVDASYTPCVASGRMYEDFR